MAAAVGAEPLRAQLARCVALKRAGDWHALRAQATQAAQTALLVPGYVADLALAMHLLANAERALGNAPAAMAAYRHSIAAALRVADRHLLSTGSGNLANLLRDAGRLDEAIEQYQQAFEYEDQALGRSQIRVNQAQALILLGELRSARDWLQQALAELEAAGVDARSRCVALGAVAMAHAMLGDAPQALALLERAHALIEAGDTDSLAANALQRASVHLGRGDRGDREAAGACFMQAFEQAAALARASLAPPHDEPYRQGFARSRACALPVEQARVLLAPGVDAKDANRWQDAAAQLEQAAARARQAGDHALALRALNNLAAVWLDAGQVGRGRAVLEQVLAEASTRGLAQAEAMALGSLAVIVERSGEQRASLGALGMYTRALALRELHVSLVMAAAASAEEQAFEAIGPLFSGALDAQIAKLAFEHGADDLAAAGFERAAMPVRPFGPSFQLANRLANGLLALQAAGRDDRARERALELDTLLASPQLPPLGRLTAHLALGRWSGAPDAAVGHLQAASDLGEALREQLPRGAARSEVNRDYPQLNHRLAERLRRAGRVPEAWQALQRGKARRLLDLLALRHGADDSPLTLTQLQSRLRGGEVVVDLALEEHGLAAYLVDRQQLRVMGFDGDPRTLAEAGFGDVEEREAQLVALVQGNAWLQRWASELCAALPERSPVLLVPDNVLHNLPLHLVPVAGQPLGDHLPIGYLPAAGVLGLVRHSRSRRSLVAGDSAGDLVFAAHECQRIAPGLGTQALLGPRCTRQAIEGALRGAELDIVHLALHGRGDARHGGRASLLLAGADGRHEWVAFDELAALRWRANLVVFSGCSTGVVGPRGGHELVSVARAALEAGAAAVVACMWPVGDPFAAHLMAAFHEALVREREHGDVDLRIVLDEARQRLRAELAVQGAAQGTAQGAAQGAAQGSPATAPRRRDGPRGWPHQAVAQRDAALAWAPFVIHGDPWLPGTNAAPPRRG
jgi:tetratricopeptide (TPR) repeat protein